MNPDHTAVFIVGEYCKMTERDDTFSYIHAVLSAIGAKFEKLKNAVLKIFASQIVRKESRKANRICAVWLEWKSYEHT